MKHQMPIIFIFHELQKDLIFIVKCDPEPALTMLFVGEDLWHLLYNVLMVWISNMIIINNNIYLFLLDEGCVSSYFL